MFENLFEDELMVGRELIQVCFGSYQMILHFDDGLSISSESKVYLAAGDQRLEAFPSAENAAKLLSLLGEKIDRLFTDSNNCTHIIFEKGHTLEFCAENDGNESYEIRIGEKRFVA